MITKEKGGLAPRNERGGKGLVLEGALEVIGKRAQDEKRSHLPTYLPLLVS